MSPYFSIIVPMYNRECFITRAIDSCLRQDFQDFEIIIIDDGSKDKSVAIVQTYTDPRIILIRHDVNRGVGPARNSGVAIATGEWLIMLDSDDELTPDALTTIYKRTLIVGNDIYRLQFMVQLDDGCLSPYPPLKYELWDYAGYIQWLEHSYNYLAETLLVVRTTTFKVIRYSNSRAFEGLYHLDFMKQFNAFVFPDVVRLYHQDANNQLTKPSIGCIIQGAKDQAENWKVLFEKHGDALKLFAPNFYMRHIAGFATLCFLCGNRLEGIIYSLATLRHNFFSLKTWGVFFFGLLGSRPTAWLKASQSSLFRSAKAKHCL